jgi:hypothetical protein
MNKRNSEVEEMRVLSATGSYHLGEKLEKN